MYIFPSGRQAFLKDFLNPEHPENSPFYRALGCGYLTQYSYLCAYYCS